MPAFTATAPGKIILFGEHAVVYGQPAMAVPVTGVQARAVALAAPRAEPGMVQIQAPDIGLEAFLHTLPVDHPLAAAVGGVFKALGVSRPPAFTLRITSTIPVAAGMGSGAAVSVAIIRAVSAFLGHPFSVEQVSALAFEVEKLHHGTPSGIDNTVVAYARPVYFVRGRPLETFTTPQPLTIVIGDTGVASPTAIAVGDVRSAWQADPGPYEALFLRIGQVVRSARAAIERGQVSSLGPLMDENHHLLRQIGVSSPELEHLVESARQAGALGAKLSGGGRGGNMIALASAENAAIIARRLEEAGATRTLITTI
ncbi:MAG: mevalonate kinase [Chloroflexota bacterium]|nr:MAG: mevalonate kinase [Chloroflexota bacterium]